MHVILPSPTVINYPMLMWYPIVYLDDRCLVNLPSIRGVILFTCLPVNNALMYPWARSECPLEAFYIYISNILNYSNKTMNIWLNRLCRKKASQAFAQLRDIWNGRQISTKTKLRIFNSNIKCVHVYISEIWKVTKVTSN